MTRSNSDDRTLSVGEVAEAFGVTPATVRAWDGNSLRSFRTPGNQRRFKLSENPRLAALLTPVSATSPQKADTGVSSSANPMAAPSASVEKSADQKPKGARAA